MLSRALILSGQQTRVLTALGARTSLNPASSAPASSAAGTLEKSGSGGTAEVEKLIRPIRLVEPGRVRLGFLPEEWFQFFYKKTGVTGPYTFGVGLITYLCSKEIFVMEHEYYTGLSIAVMAYLAVTKLGPSISSYADKEIENYENSWKQGRENEIAALNSAIKEEEKSQWQADGQLMLIEAKRENVQLQLEAAYRERIMTAYSEVKRRLDYHIERQHIENRISQKHMISWIVSQVMKSITPDQDKATLNKCIADLEHLAAKE